MENRKGAEAAALAGSSRPYSAIFCFPFSLFLLAIILGGCAAPAEPTERKAPIPEAVSDLTAAQTGDEVLLAFTLPKITAERRPLKQAPTIEIYRLIRPASASATAASSPAPELLVTIPAGMIDQYSSQGQFRYVDSLKATDFSSGEEASAQYTVRSFISPKKKSPDSNSAVLQIYPAPEPVSDLKGEMTHSGIVLTWSPPQKNVFGRPVTIAKYHIYRAELVPPESGGRDAAANPKIKSPPSQIGQSNSATYRDLQTETGKIYVYSVRSVVPHGNDALESSDSNWATVTPKPAIPPGAPQGLVTVIVPALGDSPAHVELSWAINPETDIAGYNVYRSEQEGIPGLRLNQELLLTPAFRDMNAVSGRRYSYTVTAVDRSGNESPASVAVEGGVPDEHGPSQ